MKKLLIILGILILAILATIGCFLFQPKTLGTSTRTKTVYLDRPNTFTENNTFSKGVYGIDKLYFGDASDGAISTSTGTTTLDLLGQQFPVFNFSSISLTGDAKLAFINPHPAGSVITINVAGNVVASSTADGVIDLRGLGSTVETTTGALDGLDHRNSTIYSYSGFYANNINKNNSYINGLPFVSAGTKGQDGQAGAGGLGAGGLIMKISGNLTGTSTILANGLTTATTTGSCLVHTAGGGSGSDVYIAYKGTYTGNITINNAGGDGQNKFETGSASGCSLANSPAGAGSSVASGGAPTTSASNANNASGLKAGGGGLGRCNTGGCRETYATNGLGGAGDGGVIIKIE